MYEEFGEKAAIITGAGRPKGIGQAIARRFANEGTAVVVGDICRSFEDYPEYALGTWEYLETLVKEIKAAGGKALAVKVDVSNSEEVSAMVEAAVNEFGRIDILVNNAGAAPGTTIITDMLEKSWDLTFDSCLKGAFLCSRAVVPYMTEGGRIINISSIAGKLASTRLGAYNAAKAGVILLTQTLALELGGNGITVNGICPGNVDTLLFESEIEMVANAYGLSEEETLRNYNDEAALGRLATPDDIANLATFLASDQGSFITGQSINVDGGIIYH
jgi:NAD(P)-dependent dehydrogenase (short-subunit alcohol dehydrogenase family)